MLAILISISEREVVSLTSLREFFRVKEKTKDKKLLKDDNIQLFL